MGRAGADSVGKMDMVELKSNTLYTREDLASMLGPAGINVDTFIARLRPRKVFRMVWLGEDLLDALRKAPSLCEGEVDVPPAGSEPRRRGRPRAARGGSSTSKIDQYLQSLREEEQN